MNLLTDKTAWERFIEKGKISDYLEYRNAVSMNVADILPGQEKTEMKSVVENNGTGARNTGTDRRGVR